MNRIAALSPFLAAGLCFGALPARADHIANPIAVFAGLDKITGRIISFEVKEDETVQFGTLQITPRVCYSRPQTEAPQTDGFVQIQEITGKDTYNKVFSGWMFAASPGLNGVENPIYDVWLTDCKGGTVVTATPTVADANPAAAAPASAAASASVAPSDTASLPLRAVPAKPGTLPRPRQPLPAGQADSLTPPNSLPALGAPVDIGTAPGAGVQQATGAPPAGRRNPPRTAPALNAPIDLAPLGIINNPN